MPPEDPPAGRAVMAVGLLSGGLDSTLAARLLQDQGVEVHGVHVSTGFCKVDHRRALRRRADQEKPERLRNEGLRAGADLQVPVEVLDVAESYFKEVVLHPRHGYGAAMNPCIDCRIFMLRKAAEIAEDRGADVVFTGEVVGQRPMSQHHAALRTIETESGLSGRLLRPLSAAHLPPTDAERDGRIDRGRLGAAHGRARAVQLELARRFGLDAWPAPSGGCCFLADRNFARRLRDLIAHRDPETIGRDDILLLKLGRHVRLAHDLKVVVARDEAESVFLLARAGDRWTCQVADGAGAVCLVEGDTGPGRRDATGALAARYSRHRALPEVEVALRRLGEEVRFRVRPAHPQDVDPLRI